MTRFEKSWSIYTGNGLVRSQIFSRLVILHTYLPMKMEQSVPKRRHIKL